MIPGHPTYEGEGFLVHRPFPSQELMDFDPFLLIDEMGPMDVAPGEAKGAPDHPHRGFETITYMLAGSFEHRDSQGHAGKLKPGDVQWMTAGSGLVHSETPEQEFAKSGGRMHGIQIWINLPKADKRMAPRYQEVPAAKIPSAEAGGVKVRVIAGESMGVSAVIETRIPVTYLHFTLAPGVRFEQPLPASSNALAYVLSGAGIFNGERVTEHKMVAFGQNGDSVELVAAPDEALEVLLLAAKPLHEPVARWGPFVMNTREEIIEAVEDYQAGRMGSIAH